MHRLLTLGILFSIIFPAFAQEDKSQMKHENVEPAAGILTITYDQYSKPSESIMPGFSVDVPDYKPIEPNPEAVEIPKVLVPQHLLRWNGGSLSGYNGMMSGTNFVGNHAGIAANQVWGNLSLAGSMALGKDLLNGVGVVNGVGGNVMLSYRLGNNVSLTAFGGLNNYGFMGPLPGATTAYYGGFMTLNTNNGKWGMDLGVRQVYDSMTGRWETVPIAMPYYNLGGSKIGIDIGGLLYGALRSTEQSVNQKGAENDRRGPAVIPPPIDTKPKFSPVEAPKSAGNTCLE